MRADGLIRKTYFRKLPVKTAQQGITPVFDLTGSGEDENFLEHSFLLSELMLKRDFVNLQEEGENAFHCEQDALLWCAGMIDESPTARSLYHAAEKQGWSVGLTELHNEGFLINHEERMILLDHFSLTPQMLGRSAFFSHVLLTTFIRALRDVWHENRLGAYHRNYAPKQILMIERIRAADCDTVTILCGWELRAAGYAGIWRHLLGAEEGDMAIIFSRHLEQNPGSLFNGAALAYGFRQWYADLARVDGVDHDSLEALDDVIDESDMLDPFGTTRLLPGFIEALSTLPDGTAYLAGLGAEILRNPFYAGLNDPINQAHLSQMLYDMEVVMVNNVPFRDQHLARRIFPQSDYVRVR